MTSYKTGAVVRECEYGHEHVITFEFATSPGQKQTYNDPGWPGEVHIHDARTEGGIKLHDFELTKEEEQAIFEEDREDPRW